MKRFLSSPLFLPLFLLMLMLPGVALALALDRVERDHMLAIMGMHAIHLRSMAIPFSGSYLVGFMLGLVIVIVKEIIFYAIHRNNRNHLVVWITGLISQWPRAKSRNYLTGILVGVVLLLCLLCQYVIVGISSSCVLSGMMSGLIIDWYIHLQGKQSRAETEAMNYRIMLIALAGFYIFQYCALWLKYSYI